MNQKRLIFIRISISVVSILLIFTLSLVSCAKEKETIKIGAILSLTGTGSHIVDLRDAMIMAVDEINSMGGVNGRNIELLIEDSKSNAEDGKKAFERLEKDSKKPVIYLSAFSSIGMALAPFAERYQVVLVGANTSAPKFVETNKWVFRHFFTAREEARVTRQMLSDLKVQSLGILFLDDPYGNSMLAALEKKLADHSVKVIKSAFHKDVKDLTPKLETMQDLQAIYLIGFVNQINLAIRQLRQINYPGMILTPSGGANPKNVKMPSAEGVYITAPIVYNPNYPFAKEFKEKFEKKYQKPFSHQAANGYDFIKIFAGLIEGQDVSRQNIKHIFDKGFMYSGVLGDQELEPGGQDIVFPLYPVQIKDGKLKFLRD